MPGPDLIMFIGSWMVTNKHTVKTGCTVGLSILSSMIISLASYRAVYSYVYAALSVHLPRRWFPNKGEIAPRGYNVIDLLADWRIVATWKSSHLWNGRLSKRYNVIISLEHTNCIDNMEKKKIYYISK